MQYLASEIVKLDHELILPRPALNQYFHIFLTFALEKQSQLPHVLL